MNYEYCDGITHTIKQGETLYSLSRYYKVPLAILLRANPYIDVYNLQVGDTICVPVKNCRNNRSNINTSNISTGNISTGNINTGSMNTINTNTGNIGTMPDRNISEGVQESIGMEMDESVPESVPMGMSTDTNMDSTMSNMSNMDDMGNMADMSNMNNMNASRKSDHDCDHDKEDDDDKDDEKRWIKYVAQSGDTLQDILDRSDGDEKMFWDKNNPDRMYMLPGVAYFILEKD